MISFQNAILFVLCVFFSWIIIYHLFRLWNEWKPKEPFAFIQPYDENAKGDAEDADDDPFFKKMNAEFKPVNVDDVDDMMYEMDKEVELSPKEMDFVDGNDLELPEKPSATSATKNTKIPKRMLKREQKQKQKEEEEEDIE